MSSQRASSGATPPFPLPSPACCRVTDGDRVVRCCLAAVLRVPLCSPVRTVAIALTLTSSPSRRTLHCRYEGFVLSELEALDSILDLVDLSSPAPDEEPTEFEYGDGLEDEFDGFGGLAFEEPASPPKIVRAVPAAADKSDVGVAGPKAAVPPPPGPDKVLSTSLSPKFPKASQA